MTNAVDDERRRLRARLAEIAAEQSKIEFALAVLDRIAPESTEPTKQDALTALRPPRSDRTGGNGGSTGRPGGTYQRVVETVNSSGRTWRVDSLVPALRAGGWTAKVDSETETVRAALSRAVDSGLITRVARGVYGPAEITQPSGGSDAADAEPDDAGVPDASNDGVAHDAAWGDAPDEVTEMWA